MADQRIIYNEYMVGANHPTKADTLNRLTNVEHNTDGTHKMTSGAAGVLYYHNGTKMVALPAGATTKVLVGGGAAAPVWTEATGSGAPVRATAPALVTPTRTTDPTDNDSSLALATTAFAVNQDILERTHSTENGSEQVQYPLPTSAYMLKADAGGNPVTATNTDIEVADSVAKKHTQHTDTGTTSASFKINSGGNEAELQATGLTADRDYTFPDLDTMLAGAAATTQNGFEIIAYA